MDFDTYETFPLVQPFKIFMSSRPRLEIWIDQKISKYFSNGDIDLFSIRDISRSLRDDWEFRNFKFDREDPSKVDTLISTSFDRQKKLPRAPKKLTKDSLFRLIEIETPLNLDLRYTSDVPKGVIRKLDSWLLKYDEGFGGVILSYKNVKILSRSGNLSYNPMETGISVKLRVSLVLFCPTPKSILTGVVTQVERDYVNVTVYGIILAKIPTDGVKKMKMNETVEFSVLRCEETMEKFLMIEGIINK